MKALLEDFRNTVEATAVRLRAMPEREASLHRTPGKWSPKEIVGHLVDSASNNHQRFVRVQFRDDLLFAGYDQEVWVRVQRYQDAEWTPLVQLWEAYNLHLIHVVAAMPDEVLQRPRHPHSLDQIAWQTVPASEPVTLAYFIRDYVGHLKHHLSQIFAAER